MLRVLLLLVASILLVPRSTASRAPSLPTPPGPGDLVVNEVFYAPDPSSNEFVEVVNRSERPVSLDRVTLADGNQRPDLLAPAGTILEPGDLFVAVRDSTAFAASFPGVPFHAPDGWDALNNGGDRVEIAVANVVLDAFEYDSGWGGERGASLERIDPDGPSSPFNFTASTDPSGATPGRQNATYAPDDVAPAPVFADQAGDAVVDVFFDEALDPASVQPGHFVVDGTAATSVAVLADTLVRIRAARSPRRVRVHGVADRTGNVRSDTELPVATRPEPGDLIVNELLPAPLRDAFDRRPDQPEYVEVFNRSPRLVTLRGMHLTGRVDENGASDTTAVGRPVGLPPGDYALAFTGDDHQAVHAAFPEDAGTNAVWLPVASSTLRLDNRDDRVVLHRADGAVLDAVDYTDDWHVEALASPTGTALARISPTGPSSVADNWTSSGALSGGTPGAPNAVRLSLEDAEDESGALSVTPRVFSVQRDGAARIRYRLGGTTSVARVRIYDATGRLVRTLTNARLTGPTGEFVWNGRGDDGQRLRIGIYVVLLDAVRAAAGEVETHKATVVLAREL